MLLALFVAAPFAAPLEFLAADAPLVLGYAELDQNPVPNMRRKLLEDLELPELCLSGATVYWGALGVEAGPHGASILNRCYVPGATVEQLTAEYGAISTSDGCAISRDEASATYGCALDGGLAVLRVLGAGAMDDAWLADRFSRRAARTDTASELALDAWTGPFALSLRFQDAALKALLIGEVKIASAVQYASPEQSPILWRAGQRELGSAILSLNPAWLEASAVTVGIDAAGQLAGLADLTARGEQVWSHLRPVKLPRWTGDEPVFDLELGADLAAMSELVRQPGMDPASSQALLRECGLVCALTRALGSPALAVSLIPNLSIFHGALGLSLLGLPGERRPQGQMVLGAADASAADALLAILKDTIGEESSYSRFGTFVTAGEAPSAWEGKRRVPAGLRLSLSEAAMGRRARVDRELMAHLFSVSPGGILTIELTADTRHHVLLAGSNGALPIPPRRAARPPAALGDAAAWACITELTTSDPLSLPFTWEEPWLQQDLPAMIERAQRQAELCRSTYPELSPVLQRRQAAYWTLLGIYSVESADFSSASAAWTRACAEGELMGCALLGSLPGADFSPDELPSVPEAILPMPVALPAVVLGRGAVVMGQRSCALTDVSCVGALVQDKSVLIYPYADATVGDVAALLTLGQNAWIVARSGEHLTSGRVRRDRVGEERLVGADAIDDSGSVALKPSEPAATLLLMAADGRGVDFRLTP